MHQKKAGVLNPGVDFRGFSLESLRSLLTFDLIEMYTIYMSLILKLEIVLIQNPLFSVVAVMVLLHCSLRFEKLRARFLYI